MSQPFPSDLPMVFPDWSPYPDLDSAARAYLRDPDLALEALTGVLGGADVLCFTLERFVNEVNGVWQEVAVCDGTRLTSSVRVVPLGVVSEVGTRRRLQRRADGTVRVDAVDVYVLLSSFDDGTTAGPDDPPLRQDALRFVKTLEEGGKGQIQRLEEFARTVASMIGRPL
jgi:hypothetical protein